MYRHRLINLFLLYRITKIPTITITKIIPTLIPAASPDLDFGFSAEIRANSSQHSSFKTIFNIIKLTKRLCLSLYIFFLIIYRWIQLVYKKSINLLEWIFIFKTQSDLNCKIFRSCLLSCDKLTIATFRQTSENPRHILT